MKYVYPAVFEYDKEIGAYEITFPDLPECFTWGDNIYEAIDNARDVLNLYLWGAEYFRNAPINTPSDISFHHAGERGFVQYVLADTEAYHEEMKANNPGTEFDDSRITRIKAAV